MHGTVAKKRTAAETAKAVAVKCLAEAGGDAQLASSKLAAMVSADDALFREVMTPLIKTACDEMINSLVRVNRKQVWSAEQIAEASKPGKANVLALATSTLRGLMSFPLPGGLRLAAAGAEQVLAASHFYLSQASDMAHKGRWLALIAPRVPDGKTVADVLTEADLAKLQGEAANG